MRSISAIPYYILLVIYLLLSAPITAFGQLKKKPSEKDKLIKVQRLVRANAWLNKFSGVVMVAKNGESLHKYPAGYANLDYNIQNSITAKYNLCDITHSFTALAIMQLVEQGKLDVQTPLNNYIDDFKRLEMSDKITIHNLLTHTAGLLDYYDLPDYIDNFLKIKSMQDLIQIIAKESIQFEPGTQFQRSSSNYVLLAAIIEQVSGESYIDYVQKNIIDKANLEHTGLYKWEDPVFNRATGYEFEEDGSPKKMPDSWGAFPFGSDAIYSTIEDLLLFGEILFKSERLLSQEFKDIMLTPMVYADSSDRSEAYAYGWKVKQLNGKPVIFQEGYISSLSTAFRVYPESNFSVIVYSNYYTDIAEDIIEYIEEALFNDDYVVPHHPLAYYFYGLIENKGIDFVSSNFEYILKSNQYEIDRVWTLNALGRDLLNEGKQTSALEIYKINAKFFPKEPIVYENLGEFFYIQKKYDLALASYQKKLSLLPNNRRASEMLTVIKEDKARAIAKNEYLPESVPSIDQYLAQNNSNFSSTKNHEETALALQNDPEVSIQKKPKPKLKPFMPLSSAGGSQKNVPSKALAIEDLEAKMLNQNKVNEKTTETSPDTTPPTTFEPKKEVEINTQNINSSNSQDIVLKEITSNESKQTEAPKMEQIIPIDQTNQSFSTPTIIGDLVPMEEIGNSDPNKSKEEALTAPQPSNNNLETFLKERKSNNKENQLYTVVDQMPQFGQTQAEIYQYITKNLNYPKAALLKRLEGTVLINFVINEDGAITDIRIKKGLSRGIASCDNEALRLIRIMPKWTPGYEQNKPVKVLYTLPIEFKITEEMRQKLEIEAEGKE